MGKASQQYRKTTRRILRQGQKKTPGATRRFQKALRGYLHTKIKDIH